MAGAIAVLACGVLYCAGATDVRRKGATLGLGGPSKLLLPLTKLPASQIVNQVERAILDDLCLLVLKPR